MNIGRFSRRAWVIVTGVVAAAVLAGLVAWRLPAALDLADRKEQVASAQTTLEELRGKEKDDAREADRVREDVRASERKNDKLAASLDRAERRVRSLERQLAAVQG